MQAWVHERKRYYRKIKGQIPQAAQATLHHLDDSK